MSLVESTFNQNTKLWCIAQNSTKLCHRLFSEDVSKQLDQRKLEDIQKNLCFGVPLKYKSTNTVYQYFSESAQKEKDALKVRKFQKNICKAVPFSPNVTGLQSTIFDINKNRLQEKCFLWVFWNSWKFTRKRSIMKSFD